MSEDAQVQILQCNKIESNLVELCQVMGKIDFNGILTEPLSNQKKTMTKLSQLEHEIKDLKTEKSKEQDYPLKSEEILFLKKTLQTVEATIFSVTYL